MNSPTSIYDLHDKAFHRVSAFAVLRDGSPVAKIAFKFPKDGAGRLYAYVHYLGTPMQRGHADGYGYDKRTAACAAAAKKLAATDPAAFPDYGTAYNAFKAALATDDGYSFDANLRKAGFEVFQTI